MTLNPFHPFWPYLRPYLRRIVLGLVLLTLAEAISTAIPLVLREAVDAVKEWMDAHGRLPSSSQSGGDIQRTVLLCAGAMLGLAIVQMALQMGMRWIMNSVGRRAEYDIRKDYFGHLLRLSLSYFQRTPTGDLMARAASDVNAVRMFLSMGVRMLCSAILALSMGMIVMCAIDWRLALLALLPMPVLAAIMNRVASKVHHGFREVQEQFSRMSSRIQENLTGMKVVKAFVQKDAEIAAFDASNREFLERNRKLIHVESLFFPLTFLISGASLVIILWIGGHRVIGNQLTLGDFVAFNAYLTKLIFPMITLGWMVDRYQRGLASMKRIRQVLEEPPEIQDGESVRPVEDLAGEIQFRRVTCAYDGVEVLSDIDIRVPAGSSLAVVGRVGSGKTTLGRLIPRLVEATEGEVLIDGIPVQEIPLRTLRSAIGCVPQDTFLFSDSIGENIAFGIEDAPAGDIRWASEVSQLSVDMEDIPKGLDTAVGERGVTLSGGQQQRTALARAVVRRPRILILDDAMASVDTHTEEEILTRLRDVMVGRTTVLISHRISTVQEADQIVVLHEGRIVERGTHGELVAHGGIYSGMYRRQRLTRELEQL